MQTLNLKIENADPGNIIIREGKALEQKPPEKIEISGDIKTVSAFIEKRKEISLPNEDPGLQAINKDRAVVIVDREAHSITLELDPENFYGTVVTAELEPNPDLEQFGINKNVQFSQKDLVNLLKFSRLYFEDFGKHGDLLKAYQAFTAKTYTDLANDSDSRGNKNFAFSKKVETGLPTSFVMNLPIFKGQNPKRFMVEICLDVTNAAVSFWFESVELAELTEIEGNTILSQELEACKDYVVVYK